MDMTLVREILTDRACRPKSEPFSEATARVALNCQEERLWEMTGKPAYRGDEAIIKGLGQCRVGGLCCAGDRW